MPTIRFTNPADRTVEADEGEWLYDVACRADAGIPFSCKAGACGTCATAVLEGFANLGPQTAREIRTLDSQGVDATTHRLLCLVDVCGNIVFGAPKNAVDSQSQLATFDVQVESYRPLNATVAEVRFFVEHPEFAFQPGQYMIFHVPYSDEVLRRSYSISTPPSDRRHFEVCVRAVAGGHASNYVHRLRPGMRLQVEGPYGDFVLRESSGKNILMMYIYAAVAP